jgi:hypothetical protein
MRLRFHKEPELCGRCDEVETFRGYWADGVWLSICEACDPRPCASCDGPHPELCDGCPSESECPGLALCHQCAGSGEGMADGTHCGHCKGSGHEPVTKEYDPDPTDFKERYDG